MDMVVRTRLTLRRQEIFKMLRARGYMQKSKGERCRILREGLKELTAEAEQFRASRNLEKAEAFEEYAEATRVLMWEETCTPKRRKKS